MTGFILLTFHLSLKETVRIRHRVSINYLLFRIWVSTMVDIATRVTMIYTFIDHFYIYLI